MKRSLLVLLVMVLAGSLVAGFVLVGANPSLAQEPVPQDRAPYTPSTTPSKEVTPDLAAWTLGPATPFEFTRFDGAFVPGPEGEPWANKVYILGGRTGSSTEDPTIWMFDPVAGTYTDTGADVVEDVSNYNANLVMDDGTGNGPAIYIIGGNNADGGAVNIGTVQRYYPMTNVAEALPAADDWTVAVSGSLVGAMGTAVVNDVIYVFGGWESTAAPYFYDGTWAFDPSQPSGSRWTDLGVTLNPARSYIQVAVKDNLIYAMGGIDFYDPAVPELDPTDAVEVFDPANPGAGWTAVAPMPVASAEGRGFGLDSDTLGVNSPWGDSIYVVGGGDWSANTIEAMEYDSALDYWDQAFPDLINARRDHAGVFVPICSPDPDDGLPGLWVFGGRATADTPPYAPTEFYPLECTQICNVLVVDDDWDFDDVVPNDGGLPYYTSTLDYLGYDYDTWVTVDSGDPTLADMQDYAAVIWFTGYAWNQDVFTYTNETEVGAYLDAGGNFLLSSQEYFYEMGMLTPFMADYLGIDSYLEDVIELDPVGVLGNPVGDGLGPFAMVRPDDFYTYWPTETYEGPYDDYTFAAVGSEEPFYFDASAQPNSTNYDSGTFKTIYMSWPFEWIDTVDERAAILDKALGWFCGAGAGAMELIPPAQSGSAPVGEVITYTLTILNDLGFEETFDIAYDSVWAISGPATVGPVANGASLDFLVEVTTPAEGNCFDADTASILASAQSDPVISDTAFLNSEIGWAGLGDLTGVVLDANLEDFGIADALVDISLGDLYYYTHTDADGYFTIPGIQACTFTGSASAFGYYSQMDWEVTIAPSAYTPITLTLDAAMSHLTPVDGVSIETVPDTIMETTVLLGNLGTGDLNFYITELLTDTLFPTPMGQELLPAGVDPLVYDQISASPEGQTRFIAYLAEEADLSRAYSIADRSERGWYVLNALRSTAERSQADLRQELDKAGIAYESHYLVNALVVRGGTELVSMLASHPDVAYIGADVAIPAPAPVEILPTLDAPQAIEWNISQIEADQVWATHGITGTGIVVSNIDTGVQWDHPALVNQYRGWDGATADHNFNWWDPYNQSPLVPNDTYGHGTHTMGTMVGDDGGTNQIGVAPGAQWFACDGFDDATQVGYTVELLECAEFILAPWDLTGANADPDMRPDVVNNSWGGGQAQWWYNQAIYAWRAAGIFPVFSAGNAGPSCETAGDPGDMANIMSVGATDINDAIASFSSRGPAAITGITKPNVSAPGVNIRSAVPGSTYEGGWGGTSMAAPHVAGTAALIWAAVPELRGDVQVTYWLIEQSALGLTTTQGCGGDLPDEIPNNVFGWGRINALDAVELAMTDWDVPWLSVDPFMGSVAPAGEQAIVLSLDSTGMEVGTCTDAWLLFEFNEPYITEQFFSVEMCVVEPAYAVDLSADMADSGLAGDVITYTLTVTNLGNVADTFDISLGSFDFPTSLGTTEVGPLDPGASATFEVVVEIPVGASPSDFDAVTVTVTSQTDPAATDSAVLTTTVEGPPVIYIFLPVVYK